MKNSQKKGDTGLFRIYNKDMEKNKQNTSEQKVITLLAKQLGKDATKIKVTDRIVEDIGADSLDIVEMLMSLEDTYGVVIPDDDAMQLKTVKDLVVYLEKNQA